MKHRIPLWHVPALAAILLGYGCSGGNVTTTEKDGVDLGDSADDAAEVAADTGGVFDGRPQDDNGETRPECQPGEGCFGDPCAENADCLSGLCIEHMGDRICTSFCQEECPAGFQCLQISAGGSDLLFACVSGFPFLCRPC